MEGDDEIEGELRDEEERQDSLDGTQVSNQSIIDKNESIKRCITFHNRKEFICSRDVDSSCVIMEDV